ncbi:hypothetical protein CJF32_00000857 [Rutstroemia sp. NJR-2017a WRK4]|nr:hypothetical protein CJF32_00000857 [Rutstroemia sp. NJR-2017a WRK4]
MAPKTVLITGCSEGGIGDALAQVFHRKGLRVFATARNLSKIEHLKKMGLETLPLDVTDAASIKAAVESIKSITGGTLDILVNNSGGGYAMPLLDADLSVAKQLFDLNVFAVVSVTQAFSPLLIASKGTILNIGSILGIAPMYWQGYYNASKAAIAMLTNQLRLELAPFDVKVILEITGGVKTKFFDNQPSVTLPESSVYAPAKEIVEKAASGANVEKNAVDRMVYAEKVIGNVLKKNPQTHHLAGGSAWQIWFLGTFFWHTIWDTVLQSYGNIPELKRRVKAAKKHE